MKFLLTILVLFFSTSVFAPLITKSKFSSFKDRPSSKVKTLDKDTISDFQIEGMSIGDSLLQYISYKKIQNNIIELYQHYKDQSFTTVELWQDPKLKIYDHLQINVKRDDKDFKIHALYGGYDYEDKDINECYSEMNLIADDIANFYKNIEIVGPEKQIHGADPSGKSSSTGIYFWFESGDNIAVECYDWDEEITIEKGWIDNLRVSVSTIEFSEWLWQ